jgi:hypothetical protein
VTGVVLAWKLWGGTAVQYSTSLVHVLRAAREGDAEVVVRVRDGSSVYWNSTTVRRLYGESCVRVRRGDGTTQTVSLRALPARMFTAQAPREERVVKLRVIKVITTDPMRDVVRAQLLRALATTQHGGRDGLLGMTFRDCEVMWARVPALPTELQREHARGRLAQWCSSTWGVSLRQRPQVRVPLSVIFPRAAMQRAVERLFRELGEDCRPEVKRLRRRTRYVRAQPQRVGDALCAWRKWCKESYIPGHPPV